jgi:predicted component of type VI protein secretion system
MILILTIRNAEALPEGMATHYVVGGQGAVLGRSRNCDWTLPDPTNAISSRHCELRREGDFWLARDISTNGTYLNDAVERMAEERRIAPGDLLRIGKYEILAALEADAAAEPAAAPDDNVTVMWDSLADVNKVDWARGGFGAGDGAAAPIADSASADGLVTALIEAAGLNDSEAPRSPELVQKVGGLLKRLVSGLLVMVEARTGPRRSWAPK